MAKNSSFELPNTFQWNNWAVRYAKLQHPSQPPNTSTVVFVHGTPWSSDVFRPIADALLATRRFDIVLYDLPGYGQSHVFNAQARGSGSDTEPDVSVRAQGECLAALLKHLKLAPQEDGSKAPHIIAHDIAGVISFRAHLLEGCRYQSLCLLDTNCVLPWGDGFYTLVRANPGVFEQLPGGVFEGMLRAVIQSARVPGRGLNSGWEDILAEPWLPGDDKSPQINFVRQIKQSDDQHTAELLDNNLYSNVGCDVKILWGEADGWIPHDKMMKLSELLGQRLKEFVAIPNAGHLVMLDQPERVALEIARWLER
ncbi:hypothetical protein JX265_005261 [Neoarthrinium moseri]|uniref:AB hydrolase-1 domain-containing protein n=1 Tax=Neoarthrinium moseri TaxID=1658444 RepID=A0A9Q0AS93_9PEZI|nr:hypothetical protein JX266_008495 [Neoarthrinium moseri]KAI1873639.1 hypothetical protein JX265_005261 [Neoarthrinium moseri]